MYIAILLINGSREELGRYDSPSDFRHEYPDVIYTVLGRLIYVRERIKQ